MRNPKVNQWRFLAGLEFKSNPGDLLSLLSLRSKQLWFSFWLTLPFVRTSFPLLLCFFSSVSLVPCPPPPDLLSSIRFLHGRKHEWVSSCWVKTAPTRQNSCTWDLIGANPQVPNGRGTHPPFCPCGSVCQGNSRGCLKGSKCGKHLGFHGFLWSLHECWQTSFTELSTITRTLKISYIQIWTPEIPTYHHLHTPSKPALPPDFISVEDNPILLFTQPWN